MYSTRLRFDVCPRPKSSDIKAFLCARSGAQKETPHLKFANQKVQDKKLLPETHTCLDRENHETS